MWRCLFSICLVAAPLVAQGSRIVVPRDALSKLQTNATPAVERLPHEDVSFVELVSIAEKFNTQRAKPYKWIKVASSPVSTACSWWLKGDHAFYLRAGSYCGVQGLGRPALDTHIKRVWNLIAAARREFDKTPDSNEILKLFMLPEWALGRRYPADGKNDFVPPLDFDEMQHIIVTLVGHMKSSGLDFSDWLIVPGSIYWGVKVSHLNLGPAGGGTPFDYAVFNTAPVFFGGNLVWAHNKHHQADNLHPRETWGYEFVQAFPVEPPCTPYGKGGVICGTDGFRRAVVQAHGAAAGDALVNWGLTQPVHTILVNGLAVGLDICADHRAKESLNRLQELNWLDRFDIQLLISSGMSFSIPEEDGQMAIMLRRGGIAVSSDGINGAIDATRMFIAKQDKDDYVHPTGQADPNYKVRLELKKHFVQVPSTLIRSWSQGCGFFKDNPFSNTYCNRCRNQPQFAREFASTGGGVGVFCKTETGNGEIMKIWSNPIQLPPTNMRFHSHSDGVAAAWDALARRNPNRVTRQFVPDANGVPKAVETAKVKVTTAGHGTGVSSNPTAPVLIKSAKPLAVPTAGNGPGVQWAARVNPAVGSTGIANGVSSEGAKGDCRDIAVNCDVWKPHCASTTSDYAKKNCKATCGLCHGHGNGASSNPTTGRNGSANELCPSGPACFYQAQFQTSARCFYVHEGYAGMNPTSCMQQYRGTWCPSSACVATGSTFY